MTTIHAADFAATEGKEEFKIKWTKGQPKAVSANLVGESKPVKFTKEQKAALAPVEDDTDTISVVDQFTVETPEAAVEVAPKAKKTRSPKATKTTKTRASGSSKATKTPKFVPEWMAIREQIKAGTKLKDIAAAFGVRYYDVYRVKVHGMDI